LTNISKQLLELCTIKPNKNYIQNSIDPDQIIPSQKDQVDMWTCIICASIAINPVECDKCSTLYCQGCADNVIKAPLYNKCPKRCNNDEKFQYKEKLSRWAKLSYKTAKLMCLQKSKGCNEEIFIADYEKHHTETCNYLNMICYGCEKLFNKNEIMDHINQCERLNMSCDKCGKIFDNFSIIDHFNICDAITNTFSNTCKFCKKLFYDEKEYRKHEESCNKYIVECEYCATFYNKSEESLHTVEVCNNIVKQYNQYLK
jgi:hypothetical protein